MGNPANADINTAPNTATDDTTTNTDKATKYNLDNFLKTIEEGMPKDTDPVEYLKSKIVEAEIRRRDTVSSFTKSQQSLKTLEAQKAFLEGSIKKSLKLSDEQVEELDNLKLTDPDAWRTKLNQLESEVTTSTQKMIDEEMNRIAGLTAEEFEVERRNKLIDKFVQANPSLDLRDPKVIEQIPPIYLNQLENGLCSFDEFLANTEKFLKAENISTATKVPSGAGTDVNSVRGGSKPEGSSSQPTPLEDYGNLIF